MKQRRAATITSGIEAMKAPTFPTKVISKKYVCYGLVIFAHSMRNFSLKRKCKISFLPIIESSTSKIAPNPTALRLPILVTAIVCTFSVIVAEPTPVPQRPAKTVETPSTPIPLQTTPDVGGRVATNKDDAW
jgi:hypothetical protein